MKRLSKVIFSFIIIFSIMLMNGTSIWTQQAYAWGKWNQAPQWNAPAWETPPEWQDPTWVTPPEWHTPPAWNTSPQWQTAPQWSAPAWTASDWSNSPWKTPPVWNAPVQNQPGGPGNGPEGGSGPGNVPGGSNGPSLPGQPGTNGPVAGNHPNPNFQNPGQNTLEQLNNNVRNPSDSFFEFEAPSTYDGISFVGKDVIGETINFADTIIRQDSANFGDYLSSRQNIAYAGFKTFVKGDPTLDAVYDGVDLVTGAKDIYDNYNRFQSLNTVRQIEQTGDIILAAEHMAELHRTGKTFSPGNAVVSAITMPFTVYDTVQNVGKFNEATTTQGKWDAGMDLVGNSGDMITGLAPFVAMIPGAQPIAAGMVVVGGVLSLASLGYKMFRNREKIVKDVKKKFNQAKDAVSGFFKSVFG